MKKGLAILLAVTLFITFAGPAEIYGINKEIRVRIEGNNGTLYDKYVTVTDEVYATDLLVTALGEKNILGNNTPYGFFLEGLLGETPKGNTFWGVYTVKDDVVETALVGIDSLKVEDIGEELLLHITEISWPSQTIIPNVTLTNIGGNYEVIVKDGESKGIEKVNVDISYKENLMTDGNGKASFSIGRGIYRLTLSKDGEYPEIIRYHKVLEGSDAQRIKEAIDDLKEYYKKQGQLTFRQAMGMNFASENVQELKDINIRFNISEGNSASIYAGNIMGLIAAGKDPRNYNGKNYVEELVNSQVKSGANKGQFIIGEWDSYPTTVAYSILALDMAGADYDRESAVEALLNMANGEGHYGTVDDTAMVIMALGKYKDRSGVSQLINKSLAFIRSKQLEGGGFPGYSGTSNPYSISAVIQALVANNIDPLGEEWIKNGNTMLDALFQFKKGDHFEYSSEFGKDIISATEQAFIALADLYRGKSMYHEIKEFLIEAEEEGEDFTITRIGNDSFNRGAEGRVEVSIRNNTNNIKNITFIIALFDKNKNQMINYNYITKGLEPGSIENIGSGLLIPELGSYEVRCFLWDDIEKGNILASPIIIAVE